jgi:hypothetical protein
VNGPLDRPTWWNPVVPALASGNVQVVPSEVAVNGAPYGIGWIAAAARHLHASPPGNPLVLVGHGTAGPLLPALARTQRAAGRSVAGYVFVDATLPRPGRTSHLDLAGAADPDGAAVAHDVLHQAGGTWPADAEHPRDHAFWTEPLPVVADWPDAPCAYVRTGASAPGCGDPGFWARSARARGWTAVEGDDLAALVLAAVAELPG